MARDWKGLVFGLGLLAAGIGITASVATEQQGASAEASEAAAWPEAAGRVTRSGRIGGRRSVAPIGIGHRRGEDAGMERRYREPSNSIKLLMIIVAVPLILLAAVPYWAWLMVRLVAFRLRRLVLRRMG
jgi:hypothetical protein